VSEGAADEDSGLAAERTALAWTRTALSFGAVGGVIARTHAIIGVIVIGIAPVIWQLGRLAAGRAPPDQTTRRTRLITATILLVAVIALIVASFGKATPLRVSE